MNLTRPASAGGQQSGWSRFWFQPTDPTTLGFMRIVVGLLVLYVHLAYCFDFTSFFGANAWLDTKTANKNREELPYVLNPLGWDNYKQRIQLPNLPDRRIAVFDFLKHVPATKSDRSDKFQFLETSVKRLGNTPNPILEGDFIRSLHFLKNVATMTSDERQKAVGLLSQKSLKVEEPFNHDSIPIYFFNLEPQERLERWSQALKMLPYLPDSKAGANLTFVLEWFGVLGLEDRKELIKYLGELPEGAEGIKTIEYYEFWHMDPRDAYARGKTVFSLWFHVTDPTTLWICHILILFVMLLFTLGFATRITSVMTWLAALFYIHRNNAVLFGMDTMMNVLLFYMMIGPSGAALSIDRLIARYRASRALFMAGGKSLKWAEAVLAGPRPSQMANFTIRLIQIHFCFIYMASGLAKLKGQTWWSTTAAWFIIANPEFTPIQYSVYENLLHTYSQSKLLLEILFAGMTYFTLFTEISLPFLVWTRARPYIVCLAILLHTGIAWVMGLTCFGLLMMALLLCYFPASVIRERLCWTPGTGTKFAVRYNIHNPRHSRIVAFLQAFDLTGQITFHGDGSKKQEEDLPVQLIAEHHRIVTGEDIISYAMRKLVLLRWFVYIPGVEYLVQRLVSVPAYESAHTEYRRPELQQKGKA